MSRIQKGLSLLLVCVIAFAGCKGKSTISSESLANHIPSSASTVMTINVKSLMKKMNFEKVKELDFYKEMVHEATDASPEFIEFMTNPEASGVAMDKSYYGFMEFSDQDFKDVFAGILLPIADLGKFEAAIAKTELPSATSKKDLKWIKHDEGYLVYSEKMAFMGGAGDNGLAESQIIKMFAGKSSSIASERNFAKRASENHDFAIWFSSNPVAALVTSERSIKQGLAMADIPISALKNNYVHAFYDFKNGEVVGALQYDLQKELIKDIKPMMKDKVKAKFRKYIKKENLAVALTFGIDGKGINKVLKKRGASFFIDAQLSEMSLTTDDIAKAFDGDLFFAGYNEASGPEAVFGTKVNDEKLIKKLLDMSLSTGMFVKEGDFYVGEGKNFTRDLKGKNVYFSLKNGMLLAAGSRTVIEKLASGGYASGEQIAKDKYNTISGNIFGSYIDYKEYLAIASEMSKIDGYAASNPMTELFEGNMEELQDAYSTANRKELKGWLTLNDKSRNSLEIIMEIANELYLKTKEMEAKFEKEVEADIQDIMDEVESEIEAVRK